MGYNLAAIIMKKKCMIIYFIVFLSNLSFANNGFINDSIIVLGNAINDPYRFEVMLVAHNQLANEMKGALVPTISPTHKYVKILPHSEEELDIIKSDTTLLLWDYPLNYEIVKEGTYYHDPNIADSLPTWQYCVVPINHQFSTEINCELIYNLYFPPEHDNNVFYDRLEERANIITGSITNEDINRANYWWIPSATIKAYDDVIGDYVPLQGVKVIARRFTKIKTGITNENGYCIVNGSFKYKVNYSIKWESDFWDVRNGVFGQAYYNGPSLKNQWTLNIDRGGESLIFATIHRAAYKFYYGNCLGVRRPILNFGRTKIAYLNRNASWGTGCCWGTWDLTGIIPNIFIAYPHLSVPTYDVFATTIHELGHQSHLITLGQSLYINLRKEIHESWAAAIEWRLTNHHYNEELGVDYEHHPDYQTWRPNNLSNGKTSCYTPIFIDLMDERNQGFSNNTYPYDAIINGYSISLLQNSIIPIVRTLEDLFVILDLTKPKSVSRDDIRKLMNKYWNQDYSR